MKKHFGILFLTIFFTVFMISFAGCGQSADSKGSGDGGSNDAVPASGLIYGEPSVRVWDSAGTDLIEMMVPITNNSEDILYCRKVTFKLVDKDGNVAFSHDSANMAPLYLYPSDTGILYDCFVYDKVASIPYSEDMTLEYENEIEPVTWTVFQMKVENITHEAPLNTSYVIEGDIVNDTENDAEGAQVSLVYYGADGKILGAAYGYAEDAVIPAGQTGKLKSQRYEIEGGMDNVAEIKAYAFAVKY